MFRQRRLHENAVKMFRGIELGNQREQFSFGSLISENVRLGNDAEFGAGFFLATDIDLGGRVFTDTNKREAGNGSALFERRDARG